MNSRVNATQKGRRKKTTTNDANGRRIDRPQITPNGTILVEASETLAKEDI